MFFYDFGDVLGKSAAIYRQGLTRRNCRGIRGLHYQGIQLAHFLLEKADPGADDIGPEGIGTDQFGQEIRLMGRTESFRLHFIQRNGSSPPGCLPGCFTTG
mmetsp:Transcript_17507/g.8258  ORF Transcript_17507/g.8258 Transcript_17507/m.8258 type:complete len:101 (+) Transcript_17507:165-467(+)